MTGECDRWWEDERATDELIWCAAHLHRIISPESLKGFEPAEDLRSPVNEYESSFDNQLEDSTKDNLSTNEQEPRLPIAAYPKYTNRPSFEKTASSSSDRASPIRIPDPFPLPKPAEISKMLLPLAKRVPSIFAHELDIDVTVEQTAEANGLLMMSFCPSLERWFEVHLLIDRSHSMAFWGDLAEGVATLFRWQGFFRDVRVWHFDTQHSQPRLSSGAGSIEREIRSLIAPQRNRLFVVLTDTLGQAWHSGQAFAALAILGEQHPVTIAHVFPQSLWQRTALYQAIQRPLIATHSGCTNSMLQVGARLHTTDPLYRFPIFNLSPNHFSTWANFLAGNGGNSIQGVLIRQEAPAEIKVDSSNRIDDKSPKDLLREFLTDASPKARELAGVLAAVPLIPPVMRLAQQQFLPDSQHWHLAEVFFSGLIQKSSWGNLEATVSEAWYEFKPGIRELLLENSPTLRTAEIWREIGDFIQDHYGSLRDFPALIPHRDGSIPSVPTDKDYYFAEVKVAVFMILGGEYISRAQELRQQLYQKIQERKLQDLATKLGYNLEYSPFMTCTLNTDKQEKYAYSFSQDLGNGVILEMVGIPGGEFFMGSPKGEEGSANDERPQHKVTIQPFFMSKFPITQEQYQQVMGENPYRFKGAKNPVESVSWHNAVEFCAILSKSSGRDYRLPSEAEWEYACRAGTNTPFYFGETITTQLVNYNGNYTYGSGIKGEYIGRTTEVGYFKIANAFGLYDMHGNVWEWCQDAWHENYDDAPVDGSDWIDKNHNQYRVLRGGSWNHFPADCRSANRYRDVPDNANYNFSFRVALSHFARVLS